jgi:hypothetical protein
MGEGCWALIVEPTDSDRKIISAAAHKIAPQLRLVFVDGYDDFIQTLASQGSLPTVAILEWFALGGGPISCLDTLSRMGFLTKLPVIAISRGCPMQALKEAFAFHVRRYVYKGPDDISFQSKMSEAIAEFIPGAKYMTSPIAA